MQQPNLFDYTPPATFAVAFKGSTFDTKLDADRLNGQQKRVHDAIIDGEWRSLREIAAITDDPEASISARLRDFRNDEYLSTLFIMESRRKPGAEKRGCWQYRLLRRGV